MQLTSHISAERRQAYPAVEPFLPAPPEPAMSLNLWKQDCFQAAYSGQFYTTNTIVTASRATIVQTNAGPPMSQHKKASETPTIIPGFRARDGIFELRRLSGFTWDELAGLLSVTRRSLHLWANGGPINTSNEKRVRDLLVAMRKLDRGTARENRGLLIAPQPGGGAFSDLLRSQRFEEALALAGRGRGRAVSMELPANKRRSAAKPSVAEMLGSSADRIHSDKGGSLPPRGGPRRI
jgi:hypothetical protein